MKSPLCLVHLANQVSGIVVPIKYTHNNVKATGFDVIDDNAHIILSVEPRLGRTDLYPEKWIVTDKRKGRMFYVNVIKEIGVHPVEKGHTGYSLKGYTAEQIKSIRQNGTKYDTYSNE